MGMFDTIIGELECPQCGKTKERELQTHRGPCLLDTYYLGDTIEPFYFGDYRFEEEWYCRDCYQSAREKDENAKPDWQKAYVRCINGMIVEVSMNKVEDETLPDWSLLHKISRDRHNYRSNLLKIDGMIQRFTQLNGKETHFLFDEGFKTADQVLEKIQEVIAGALSGEPPGLL